MKSLLFISDSLKLYFFKNRSFKNVANKTSLKSSIFTLFLLNLIFSLLYFFILSEKNIESFILILINMIIGTIYVAIILMIISLIYHLFYMLFKSKAKFRKLYIMFISTSIGMFFYSLIIIGLFTLTNIYPNIPYNLSIKIAIAFLYFILFIWNIIVNIYYFGKIERVLTLKSFFAYLIIYLIVGLIIGFTKYDYFYNILMRFTGF